MKVMPKNPNPPMNIPNGEGDSGISVGSSVDAKSLLLLLFLLTIDQDVDRGRRISVASACQLLANSSATLYFKAGRYNWIGGAWNFKGDSKTTSSDVGVSVKVGGLTE